MDKSFEPSGKEAMSLAAFRWFANTIENDAIALFATDRSNYREIEDVLRRTLRELRELKSRTQMYEESNGGDHNGEENGCPDGYVLCNGICMPSCENIES